MITLLLVGIAFQVWSILHVAERVTWYQDDVDAERNIAAWRAS